MAAMGEQLVMDDDFMRGISRCCQCGNESRKPERLKFLPCSHLMCIRCLEGVRTGTNTTARTPRTAREDSVRNGDIPNGTHRCEEEIFLTEVGDLPEGKREMYTKAYCPACDKSFLVPNTNLSIFEDDFHKTGILSRFIQGQKHACERCIEKEKERELEKLKEEEEAPKKERKGHTHEEKPKPVQKKPQRESRGVNTSPPSPKKEDPPSPRKGAANAKGPARRGSKAAPGGGGAKRKGAAGPAKGRPPGKGAKREPSPPPKSPTPPPPTPPPPTPKPLTPPAESPRSASDKEDSPRSGSAKSAHTSRRSSKASTSQKSETSTLHTNGDMSEMTLDIDGTIAEFYCMGCGRFLCPACSHEHLTPENLKEHRLVPAHEYSLSTQEEDVKCLKHPDKKYTHFCLKEKCQRAVCAKCLNEAHNDHRVEPIAKVIRDPGVLREVLNNSKAIEMKVKLRMGELKQSKIQESVIDALNDEIEQLKAGYVALLDAYKGGINSRFNEINGKIEIDETRVHSYMEKLKKMNGILSNVINRPDYADQDLLILTHFLAANQTILTDERKVDSLMREKTIVPQHLALDLGDLQSIFKSTKELPQTIPFDLRKTARVDFPLPKHLSCACCCKSMVYPCRPHDLAIMKNNDVVVLDAKGPSVTKYQCVNARGVKQLQFQYMYYAREKPSSTLLSPAGIAVYEGYTLVCDTAPNAKGAPKRGQIIVFDSKLNQIDAIPLEAIPHCMACYEDQVYVGFKTKVMHYQIYTEDKYSGEVEFNLEHAGTYFCPTEWWSYLAVNREGHLAINNGNSEITIFKDGQQALKPSVKLRGTNGISFLGTQHLMVVNSDKSNITAYSLKEDANGHPIVDKELPDVLLTAREKLKNPLTAKMDYDGDLVVSEEKGNVKLFLSPR